MAGIGGLKGARTRAKNSLNAAAAGIRDITNQRANVEGMNPAQLADLWHVTDSKLGDIRMKFERLETANEKLAQAYAEDADLEAQFQTVLTEEANLMDQFVTAINELETLTKTIDRKLAQRDLRGAKAEGADGDFADKVTQLLTKLTTAQNAAPAGHGGHAPAVQDTIKLPKIEIPKFSGNIMKWTAFWAQFDSSVHSKAHLAAINKFNYLRAHLTGEALSTIEGLQLTEPNYTVAVNLLRERFGKDQLIIDAHYTALTNMSNASVDTAKLRIFYDTLERHLRSLTAQGEQIENRQMVNLIRGKLPEEIMFLLERMKDLDTVWTVPLLRQHLKAHLAVRESLKQSSQFSNSSGFAFKGFEHPKSTYKPWSDSKSKIVPKSSAEALLVDEHSALGKVATLPSRPCVFCRQQHWPNNCNVYTTLNARRSKLKGICLNCLVSGHVVKDCRSKKPCYYCKKWGHHEAICQEKFSRTPSKVDTPKPKPASGAKPKIELGAMTAEVDKEDIKSETELLATEEEVIMQTAQTTLANPDAPIEEVARLLMDCGSYRTYMAESLAKRLKLKLGKMTTITISTFGTDKLKTIQSPTARVKLKLRNGTWKEITVNVVPQISATMHRMPIMIEKLADGALKNFFMADTQPTVVERSSIELLIGNDYYLDFILPRKYEIQPGLYVLDSYFGYILAGRLDCKNKDKLVEEQQLLILNYGNNLPPESTLFTSPDASLPVEPNMEKFWALETIGIEEPSIESDDKIAFQKFNETVQIKDDRFEVSWPWRDTEPELPENYGLAYSRFKSVAKQFEKNPQLLEKYDKVIQEQVRLGIIEKVTPDSEEGPIKHYVPHHPVVTEDKATTKLRIVYDASAKTKKSNKSLNECLYRGPVLLHDLCGLLLRFRLHNVALVSDIEKAFLNIGLKIEDRDVTRFFWFKDPKNPTLDENVQIYRFCRIPFGVISSPFLLAGTINYLMDLIGTVVATQIKQDIYVDNVITGTESVPAAVQLYNESQDIFKKVSLNLREWASNSQQFIAQIPPVHRAEGTTFKVLGVTWNTNEDCLQITGSNKANFESVTTKREVLKVLAMIYDPLGFYTPVTLKAKLFLHSLWSAKLDWDSRIPDNKVSEWQEIATQLKAIAMHKIPRFIADSSNVQLTFRLLCFCDASADGYATAIYLHSSGHGTCEAHLVFSKTRLSPQQIMSIPRLELMATLIGVRSLQFVQAHLHLPIQSKILWTDSQCVLHWIRSTKPLSVFVANRVNKIKEEQHVSFRYVHTTQNPADLATRGRSVEELNESIWWHGPHWLQNDENDWPTYDVPVIDPPMLKTIEAEVRKKAVSFEIGLPVGEGPLETMVTPYMIDHKKFSSLQRLLRVTAWCTRYVQRLKLRCQSNEESDLTVKTVIPFAALEITPLTADEIANAKILWELQLQKHWFLEVIQAIDDSKRHNLSDQLNLRRDKNGLLRSHGRFVNAELTEGARQPKLLPKNDYFTKLVINDVHEQTLHSGVSQTLATIRHEYWIPQGRSKVRLILKECRVCRRIAGGPFKLPKMAPWPNLRVSRSAPFTHTGLDYFGPLYVKVSPNSPAKKVWVCLFTCTAIRAVHLELVEDMTTEQFLLCLRRFIARFGKPQEIISDNASQFKLASGTLAKLWAKVRHDPETLNYVAQQGIKWNFIVELAPWMGGFYERMVGLVKTSLKKAIGKLCLATVMLQTLLSEVEAVVNSRPLVYVGDDINSTVAISPASFLSQNTYTGVPVLDTEGVRDDPDYETRMNSHEKLLQLWKKGQEHLNRFWDIWSSEYLLSLRERTQHHVKAGRIQSEFLPSVGDVVLIKENLPRGMWKLGKITELLPSQDGQIRTAKILLQSCNILSRRINLLCPVECPARESFDANYNIDSAVRNAVLPPQLDNVDQPVQINGGTVNNDDVNTTVTNQRPRRNAFLQAQRNIRQMAED